MIVWLIPQFMEFPVAYFSMSMIAGYSPPPTLLAQARKIAPFSQEDMNHTR